MTHRPESGEPGARAPHGFSAVVAWQAPLPPPCCGRSRRRVSVPAASRLRCGMLLFEWTLVLLLAAVLLAALARRLEVPYPALLALAGAVLAFLPIAPQIEIDPDLALALFVAPVLLDAAFD